MLDYNCKNITFLNWTKILPESVYVCNFSEKLVCLIQFNISYFMSNSKHNHKGHFPNRFVFIFSYSNHSLFLKANPNSLIFFQLFTDSTLQSLPSVTHFLQHTLVTSRNPATLAIFSISSYNSYASFLHDLQHKAINERLMHTKNMTWWGRQTLELSGDG